ncbi:bifunctional Leucine-rich repeat domain superfamily/Leucine-rich repeat/Tubulin-specific chaperone E/CAP Gly-rich domain superfamily [Babesia duncani]|uniref:Bifunctional Leucine-rich repeat domain superfamily/Leucine-rich repeat/Tubulin-specific chaperone E/CAP Gly-rich domain superfamily n=1 Tax=Babesia duncani TaxID=323732 RepID=A0AAD9PIV3_9APIC|nr:bifunctional Leucine-rich repeat domain superfamily/Leucine-rich repeat/Tubulin-specific chaperone E/CAP Gly-rich domain superfamily [Babesia duncani]
MELQIGQRVLYGKCIGTVRFKGHVDSTCEIGIREQKFYSSQLLAGPRTQEPEHESPVDSTSDQTQATEVVGVEWDDWFRGTHNGLYYFSSHQLSLYTSIIEKLSMAFESSKDVDLLPAVLQHHVFGMVANNPNCCSFMHARDLQLGISLERAIIDRYLTDDANAQDHYVGGKPGVFVGRETAVEFFSDTENLYSIGLSKCNIDCIGNCFKFKFTRLRDLRIDFNLLYSWDVVASILELIPKLKLLDISGNIFYTDVTKKLKSDSLQTLSMNKCLVSAEVAFLVASQMSSLTRLNLSSNGIVDCSDLIVLEQLEELDLSGNFIHDWHAVFKFLSATPNLTLLNLSCNRLANIYTNGENHIDIADAVEGLHFPNLTHLYLDENYITRWSTIANLSLVFTNLTDLRFSLHGTTGANASVHFQVLVAIFPNLKTLNGTEITKSQRVHAERYYISLMGSKALMFIETNLKDSNGVYTLQRLEVEHQTLAPVQSNSEKLALNRAQEMISLTLVPDADAQSFSRKAVVRTLSNTTTIGDLKSLCARIFFLRVHEIRLVYNDGHMPICEELDDDNCTLSQYGIASGYNIRVQLKEAL